MPDTPVQTIRKAQPMNLFVFGLGYSALEFINQHRNEFVSIAGTVRDEKKAQELADQDIQAIAWDGASFSDALARMISETDELIISVPPDRDGDRIVRYFHETIVKAPLLRTIVYLSTIGVYGDHDGEWVNEETVPSPANPRSQHRLRAENDWIALARAKGVSLHILRLAGIYGPGRNALETLRKGTAKRIVKPGQVFNRIHVSDIARSITACLDFPEAGSVHVWNVCDDKPTPPQDLIVHAATLLAMRPPPETDFANADMSDMARSFYSENKRVSNDRLKSELGVRLAYPTYREGLRALAATLLPVDTE